MEKGKQDVEQLLRAGKAVQLRVPTTSMYQFIRPDRDEAIIAPLDDPHRLHRGDVALYRRDSGMLVLHRVHRHRDGVLFMVGDNQTKLEGPLREDQFIGILDAIKRDNRIFSVRNPVYLILSRIWLFLRPLRPVFWRIHKVINHNL